MIAHAGHDHGMHHLAPHLFAALIACAALLFVLRRVLIAVRGRPLTDNPTKEN